MIYECPDCKHCANFHDGYRVVCLHPELPANAVIDYHPVGDGNALTCLEFDDNDDPHYFTSGQLTEAFDYSEAKYDDATYDGVREWCLSKILERKAHE